ncbi:MAG TPA: hypothetical protein VNK41_08990 [Vicinamibacterales bacterium]|nr:hypothetical protein [Vicinamibacterales bacterium]
MMEAAVLDRISEKVASGEPLAEQEVRELTSTHDILALGSLADRVRRRRHGPRTTFLRVANLSAAQVSESIAVPPAAREIRLAGPVSSLDEAAKAVRAAARIDARLPLSGFSLADIDAAARAAGTGLAAALQRLRDAGLAMVAEAPIDWDGWRGALDAAAAAGVRVPRLTVDAARAGIVPLLARVAEACRMSGVSSVFAPLPRRPGPEPTTGYEDVKAVALARLLTDVEHIQVDWQLHGPKLAQVALTVGADDVDNVAAADDHPEGRRRAPLEEILRNIRAAGLEPVQRDASFAVVP